MQGGSTDLYTVLCLTNTASGNSYTWTPISNLPDGDDYALKIQQSNESPNYTGLFAITGGSTVASLTPPDSSKSTA